MKFIAYNPATGKKIALRELKYDDGIHGLKVFYSDSDGNLVHNQVLKKLFEAEQYPTSMQVEIDKQPYYLIGER
ncbi:hypothetical protein ACT4Z3_09730 [Acinetobacter baumannii]